MKIPDKKTSILILIAAFAIAIPLFSVRVDGDSMAPTMFDGESYFLNRLAKNPIPEKVIVAKIELPYADSFTETKQELLIKRVKDINENNCLWLEGDNTDDLSYDSRDFGWFCEYNVLGTVMFK